MGAVGCDAKFVITIVGASKVFQFACSIALAITIASTKFSSVSSTGSLGFVAFTAAFGIFTLLASLLIYFLKLYNIPKIKNLPWRKIETIFAIGCAVLFLVSMAICADWTKAWENQRLALICSTVFALANSLEFTALAILLWRGIHLPSDQEA